MMTWRCCGETNERYMTNTELDREPSETDRALAEKDRQIAESGEFGPEGGTLSDRDFEDAVTAS